MPWGLKRYQNVGTLHFITFSCYRRQPLLMRHGAVQMFEQALEEARAKYGFFVFGYVVMPEHVHLLVSEPERGTLATAIKALKQSVARRQIKLGGGISASQPKDGCVGHPKQETPALLADEILRLQRRHSPKAHREAEVHPPQPRPSWFGRTSPRLALEQLPSLRARRSRHRPNRIARRGLEAETDRQAEHPGIAGINGRRVRPITSQRDWRPFPPLRKRVKPCNVRQGSVSPHGLRLRPQPFVVLRKPRERFSTGDDGRACQ